MLHPDAPMSTMQTDMPAPQDIMPASEASCRASLRKMGATFREIPRIQDGANCGIAWPIKLSGVGGGVSVNETPMNCQVALAFAQWTRNELVPCENYQIYLLPASADQKAELLLNSKQPDFSIKVAEEKLKQAKELEEFKQAAKLQQINMSMTRPPMTREEVMKLLDDDIIPEIRTVTPENEEKEEDE